MPLLHLVLWMTQAVPVAASHPAPDPQSLGPRVGERLPAFSLADQDGRTRDFASLTGPKGLVLVFFRSADW